MNKVWHGGLVMAFLLVFASFLSGCEGNGASGYLPGNIFAETTNGSITASGALLNEQEADFLRFADEAARISALFDLSKELPPAKSMSFTSNRDEDTDFIIDLVHPASESRVLNRMVSNKVAGLVSDFTAFNSGGSFYLRPFVFVHDEFILGLVLDARSFGNRQGFAANRHIIFFDLNEEAQVCPYDFITSEFFTQETEADFRLILTEAFADNNFSLALTGYEDFTFDDDYIYLHVRTHENTNVNESYITLTLPLIYFKDAVAQGSYAGAGVNGPRIAITFDDGPHNQHTTQLLDALKAKGVPATFFVMGSSVGSNAEIIKRMHDEGHLIGNHSFNHENFSRLSIAEIKKNLEDTNRRIHEITGVNPTVLRPPFGFYNQSVLSAAKDLDMSVVLWSIDPKDWQFMNAKYILDVVMEHAKDGSVILLHDIYETTVEAAIMIIDTLHSKGYTFVTVDELFDKADMAMEAGAMYRSVYREVVRN